MCREGTGVESVSVVEVRRSEGEKEGQQKSRKGERRTGVGGEKRERGGRERGWKREGTKEGKRKVERERTGREKISPLLGLNTSIVKSIVFCVKGGCFSTRI